MTRICTLILTLFVTISMVLTGCSQKETSTSPTTQPVVSTTTTTTQNNVTTNPSVATTTTTQPTKPPQNSTTTTNTPTPKAKFQASSPVTVFTDEDIAFLNISFAGSPSEIADAIKKWQEDTWVYASDVMDFQDVSDPIRWNYFLPGIFSSRDIIREQVRNGKIYGICFSYAVTYCSIAEYYGLETRVMNSLSKPSDSNPNIGFTTGMSPEEYNRLKIKLDKLGLRYDYEAVRLVAEETPTHYWAEVKINGQWVIKDATQKATGNDTKSIFVDTGDFEVTNWLSRDRSSELDEYQARLDRGERLPEPDGGNTGPGGIDKPANYTGITDDLGQKGRAASIDDLMSGWALAPYFNNAGDAYTYIRATGISPEDIANSQALKLAYEMMSGKKMYVVALLISQDEPEEKMAETYYNLCGEQLDIEVYNQLKAQYID